MFYFLQMSIVHHSHQRCSLTLKKIIWTTKYYSKSRRFIADLMAIISLKASFAGTSQNITFFNKSGGRRRWLVSSSLIRWAGKVFLSSVLPPSQTLRIMQPTQRVVNLYNHRRLTLQLFCLPRFWLQPNTITSDNEIHTKGSIATFKLYVFFFVFYRTFEFGNKQHE